MGIILAVMAFMFIIIVHEWGHFILARKLGVKVLEFSIGMGPRIWGRKTKKDMDFSIRALPIGGFCSMLGEDESVDEEGSYSSLVPWKRMLIVAAGPVMNFILAFVISFIIVISSGFVTPTVSRVDAGTPVEQAGLETGDVITAINGKSIHVWQEISFEMSIGAADGIEMEIKKPAGTEKTIAFRPVVNKEEGTYELGFGLKKTGTIGRAARENGLPGVISFIGGCLAQAFWLLLFYMSQLIRTVALLASGRVSFRALSGPIGIVSAMDTVYKRSIVESVASALRESAAFTALISANIGMFNIVPIPALDGGRLFLLLIEQITGKKLPPKAEQWIINGTFVLLLTLMIFVAYNDIRNII